MDEPIVGYALDLLTAAERAAVEARLAADPAARAALAAVRRALDPLAADRDIAPPPGLAVDTVARVAAHAVEHKMLDADPSAVTKDNIPVLPQKAVPAASGSHAPVRGGGFLAGRRVDAAVAAAVAVLAVGLVTSGIARMRADQQRAACGNNLRALYGGLSEYAAANAGQFPLIDGKARPTAAAFVPALADAGVYPADLLIVCPAAPGDLAGFRPAALVPPPDAVLQRVGYVYTLGHRTEDGTLVGVRADDDLVSLAADLPAAGFAPHAGRVSPHGRGQNVLFVGGAVRFVTVPTVGPNGDDIFRNDANKVRAGLHRNDVSLGGPTDVP